MAIALGNLGLSGARECCGAAIHAHQFRFDCGTTEGGFSGFIRILSGPFSALKSNDAGGSITVPRGITLKLWERGDKDSRHRFLGLGMLERLREGDR